MKVSVALFLVASQLALQAQGLVLNTGDTYVFEFTSVAYYGPARPTQGGLFFARFTAESFSQTDSLRVELFSDCLSDTPLVRTVSLPTYAQESAHSGGYATILWSQFEPPFWPDLQGMARLTMLTGSAEMDGIGVSQVLDGTLYSQFFPVPEPSPLALLLVGLGIWLLLRVRRAPSELQHDH